MTGLAGSATPFSPGTATVPVRSGSAAVQTPRYYKGSLHYDESGSPKKLNVLIYSAGTVVLLH